ncbi:unnamed protein product [Rotaria socialis]
MIGEDEQLKRLYALSRILVFERVGYQHKSHFIQAIVKCSIDPRRFTHMIAFHYVLLFSSLVQLLKMIINLVN